MTWQEVLNSIHKTVIVQSYGYEEVGHFNSHFEPFSKLREFVFKIHREPFYKGLSHKWLNFENEESEFYEEKDSKLYCFDPDLWARS